MKVLHISRKLTLWAIQKYFQTFSLTANNVEIEAKSLVQTKVVTLYILLMSIGDLQLSFNVK